MSINAEHTLVWESIDAEFTVRQSTGSRCSYFGMCSRSFDRSHDCIVKVSTQPSSPVLVPPHRLGKLG
jgi:hypothetical protein